MIDWSDKVASCAKGVVHNYRNPCLMCNRDHLLKVWDVVPRVANAFELHTISQFYHIRLQQTHIDSLGLVINSSLEILRRIAVDKFSRYTQTWKHNLQLIVRSPIQV